MTNMLNDTEPIPHSQLRQLSGWPVVLRRSRQVATSHHDEQPSPDSHHYHKATASHDHVKRHNHTTADSSGNGHQLQ